MEVTGKLIKKLQAESGTSKAGKPWEKQICLVETDAKYNPLIAVEAFGEDHVKQMNKLKVGMQVEIKCNVYSEEWKGKYFNKIRGYFFVDKSNAEQKQDFSPTDFITSDDVPF
tara:strand:+ start:373 stop:711 length:339 start_codon:yes stop_codon:yes gene_type:complete